MATVISITTSEEKILVTLSPKTAAGNDASVENPVWSVQSGDATLEPSADGLSCMLISGASGINEISVVAAADLGITVGVAEPK
jgi:hypothetical protein